MVKVNSWIRCDAVDGGCYHIDRDGDPREIIDMAISTTKAELWDNLQLLRYAKTQTRRMFRELWKASDKHDKLMYLLDTIVSYTGAIVWMLVGVMLIGFGIKALERLVFG